MLIRQLLTFTDACVSGKPEHASRTYKDLYGTGPEGLRRSVWVLIRVKGVGGVNGLSASRALDSLSGGSGIYLCLPAPLDFLFGQVQPATRARPAPRPCPVRTRPAPRHLDLQPDLPARRLHLSHSYRLWLGYVVGPERDLQSIIETFPKGSHFDLNLGGSMAS